MWSAVRDEVWVFGFSCILGKYSVVSMSMEIKRHFPAHPSLSLDASPRAAPHAASVPLAAPLRGGRPVVRNAETGLHTL